jgi:hypothetical protein
MSTNESATKLVYSPAEVARMIGTSEWWVREQMRRRRVPHLRLGARHYALRAEDIPALLEVFAVDAEPEPVETPDVGEKLQQISDLAVVGLSRRSLAAHQRPSRYNPALPERPAGTGPGRAAGALGQPS